MKATHAATIKTTGATITKSSKTTADTDNTATETKQRRRRRRSNIIRSHPGCINDAAVLAPYHPEPPPHAIPSHGWGGLP
eukprot:3600547-Pyramimonas_sp.AAC.1